MTKPRRVCIPFSLLSLCFLFAFSLLTTSLAFSAIAGLSKGDWVLGRDDQVPDPSLFQANKDARTVGNVTCLKCHPTGERPREGTDLDARLWSRSLHSKHENAGKCETCHGPSSLHNEANTEEFTTNPRKLTRDQQNKLCLTCHRSSRFPMQHGTTDLSCLDCHRVHEYNNPNSLIKKDQTDVCASCHPQRKGHFQSTYRMPFREERVVCSSCHSPHGSPYSAMLKEASTNQNCYTCHAEKRGPFLWEHAPVRENCANCHDPHGSENPGMMVAKGAFQCVQCHQYGGHINEIKYNRSTSPWSRGCVNCHVRVHGSNHPSGARFTR